MMRDVFDFLGQRGTLLAPDALRYLQAHERPLEVVRLVLTGEDARGPPLVLTREMLEGVRAVLAQRQPPASAVSPVSLASAAWPASSATPARTLGGAPLAAAVASAQTIGQLHAVTGTSPGRPIPSAIVAVPMLPAAPLPLPLPLPSSLGGSAQVSRSEALQAPQLSSLGPASPLLEGPSPVEVAAHGMLPGSAPLVDILKDITGKSTCTGEMTDFGRYFNDRLKVLRRMLKQRREMQGHVAIDAIPKADGVVRLIGMVSEVRKTKNGYRIIELEDETGSVPILVLNNDHRNIELGEEAERILQDEVIGVHAKVRAGKDILYLQDMFRPDVPNDFEPRRAPDPALACFLSDTHFGAKTFLGDKWDNFVRFLNGQGADKEQRAKAERIKFIVIAGDVVDGIGVYPGQEPELAIPDIEGQYEFAAKQLARIPSRIRIVVLPGNHDASRPAEPQPAMAGDRLIKHFTPNVTQVGNPSQVSLMGVEVLAYHGVSLIDYITNLRGLNVHRPVAIMEELLKRRHIAPLYGGHAPIAPEFRDYMVIERLPDIFVTGHLHTCEMGDYKGVTLINAGTWQGQTSYQKTLGIEPQPALVATVDLRTGARTMMDFNKPAGAAAA